MIFAEVIYKKRTIICKKQTWGVFYFFTILPLIRLQPVEHSDLNTVCIIIGQSGSITVIILAPGIGEEEAEILQFYFNPSVYLISHSSSSHFSFLICHFSFIIAG